ncbi:MAG: OmpA family protein [Nannocystaceae bacterium]
MVARRGFADGTTIAIVPSAPPRCRSRCPTASSCARRSSSPRTPRGSSRSPTRCSTRPWPRSRPIRRSARSASRATPAPTATTRTTSISSARRAASVREYLVSKGVPADLLVAEGFGETRPIADNETSEGREANRRVELHVVEVEGGGGAGTPPDAAAP